MAPLVVVMGVSGSGKSTVGAALAHRLGVAFIEGDNLHSRSNIAKMSAAIALDDEDRRPWLDAIGAALAAARRDGRGAVASCSALKDSYRRRLEAAAGGRVLFVFLNGTPAMIAGRLQDRAGHYMPPALLQSQFETLEKPRPGEALMLDIAMPPAELVETAARWIEAEL